MSDQNDFDLMDPAVQQCPYAGYKRLRDTEPLYKLASADFHLVSQYYLSR